MMPPSRAALAKIHIAKKELAMTDEVYRDILHVHFKVDSAAKLTDRQATVLLNKFRAKGWKEKQSRQKPTSPKHDDSQMRKIVALWITMHQAGIVKNGSDKALQAYVKRQTGVDNLRWCDPGQLWTLIEGLKRWAAREKVDVEYP
jgi:phage gp16-like protein